MARVIWGESTSALSAAPDDRAVLSSTLRRGVMAAVAIGVVLQVMLMFGALLVGVLADAAVPGRNVATLWGLLFLGVVLYGVFGLLDTLRARLLFDVAGAVDQQLAPRIHDGVAFVARTGVLEGDGLGPIHDADRLRHFLTGPMPAALIDLCLAPIALIMLFALHVWLGVAGLAAMILIALIGWAMGGSAGRRAEWLAEMRPLRWLSAEEGRRHALTARAMGMEGRLRQRWLGMAQDMILTERAMHRRSVGLAGAVRGLRLMMFITLLSIGAGLAFSDRAAWSTALIAALLFYQLLAPLDQVVSGWGAVKTARMALDRLNVLLGQLPMRDVTTLLPRPEAEMSTDQLFVLAPGVQRPVVSNVGIVLKAGDSLGIMGAPGSGKTALLNALAGVWPAARGVIRLDGAALDQWDTEELGKYIGYVPQQIELIDGTVAQNIARFDADASTDAIIAAARRADVHELILRLPEGYETMVGRDGLHLPGGMRQRIAVARAVFGKPFLILLDDPTSNMDGDGEKMLCELIADMCDEVSIVVVVTHRPPLLNRVDHIMQMEGGSIGAFGPRGQIMQFLQDQRAAG